MLAIGAVVVLAIGAFVVLGKSDDDSGSGAGVATGDDRPAATAAPGSGSSGTQARTLLVGGAVEINVPAGWASKDVTRPYPGVVLALDPADFDRTPPGKTSLRILYINDPAAAANPEQVLTSFVSAADKTTVIAPPYRVGFGKRRHLDGYETNVKHMYGATEVFGDYLVLTDPAKKRVVVFQLQYTAALQREAVDLPQKPYGRLLAILDTMDFK